LLIALAVTEAAAIPAVGLTKDNRLLVFDTDVPYLVEAHDITGLQPGEVMMAIDFRQTDRRLYGFTSEARIYRIDPATGAALHIGIGGNVYLPVNGVEFGFDFDPVADVIRVISDTGQNFRVTPDNGLAIDTDENAPDTQGDTPLSPGNPDVRGAAYTWSFLGSNVTRLYVIDAATDQLMYSDAPNSGVLTAVGPLGVDVTADVAFDIAGQSNTAILTLPAGPMLGSRLYTINLATGQATAGAIVGSADLDERLRGLALIWSGDMIRVVTADNHLVRFFSMTPQTALSTIAITGLQPGETIHGIDYRPSRPNDDTMYALGSTGRLYRLSIAGVATQVGLAPINLPLQGTQFGIAFDPDTDLLRVVSNQRQNFRVNVDTATVVDGDPDTEGVQPDTPLSPATVEVSSIAYTKAPVGNLARSLAGFDTTHAALVRIGGMNGDPSPDTGIVASIGEFDTGGGDSGFDWSDRENIGYASVSHLGENRLMRVTPNGGAFAIGSIAAPSSVVALAVEPGGSVQFDAEDIFGYIAEPGEHHLIVRRSFPALPARIQMTYTGGTATRNDDFSPSGFSTFEFAAGESTKEEVIYAYADALVEPAETVVLTITQPSPGLAIGEHSVAIVTIQDVDGPPNAPPTVTIVSPTTEPEFAAPDTFITLAGTASDDVGIVSVTWETDEGEAGVATGTTNWTIEHLPIGTAGSLVTVTAVDTQGKIDTDTLFVTRELDRYSLAEGSTGAFFDTDLLIANPNPVEAPIEITFVRGDGTTVEQQRVLPPASRTTIAVDEIAGLEATEVSTFVRRTGNAPLRLAVERTMRWDATGYGAHTEKAVNGPGAKTWYFAEGSQGFFSTYLLLANPNDLPTVATTEMFTEDGAAAFTQQYPLAAHSRLTIDAGAIPPLVNRSFWTRVTFSTTGIAERAMYFGSPLFNAGHESAGVPGPSTTWFHAEGATGGFFTTFLLLVNPNDQSTDVTVTYLPTGAAPVAAQKVIPAHGRLTINIALEHPSLTDAAVATRVVSTRPILSERSMYWPGPASQWNEAHNSVGETDTDTRWALAEGRVGGPLDYRTYILIANPGDAPAHVAITYLREGGGTIQKEYVVPATSRYTVDVATFVPELSNEGFSSVIQSSTPVFVERSMYSNVGGVLWSAGTNATATRLP
jgi:hypothetical protein